MQKRRILIVEDDPSTRRLLQALIQRNGDVPEVAASGAQALQLIDRAHFDLAIVDLMMAEVNGERVIEHLRQRQPSTPVIICSASGPAVTDPLLKGNVRRIVRKPFDIADMIGAVDDHALSAGARKLSTVLIVDDDAAARYVMRQLVSPNQVIETEDAEVALEAVRTQRPDAVMLDLKLPGMSGEELLERLKDDSSTADIPVIIVTSRKLASHTEVASLRRADAYIYKGDLTRDVVNAVLQIVVTPPGGPFEPPPNDAGTDAQPV